MKKMMMTLAALSLAGAANAAISFTATNLGDAYNGYTIACANKSYYDLEDLDSVTKSLAQTLLTPDALSQQLVDAGYDTWAKYYSAVAKSYATAVVADGASTITVDTSNNGPFEKYSAVFVLFENGVTPGSKYVLFETVDYDGESTYSPTFDMTNASVLQKGSLKTDETPEPTSGLLMLVGLAGLALKRKRA